MSNSQYLVAGAMTWILSGAWLVATPRRPIQNTPNLLASENPTGQLRTYKSNGAIDLDNLFFQSVGTNGRSCSSCHQPSDAWTVTPAHIQARFNATDGLDPIFRTNDG